MNTTKDTKKEELMRDHIKASFGASGVVSHPNSKEKQCVESGVFSEIRERSQFGCMLEMDMNIKAYIKCSSEFTIENNNKGDKIA